LIEGLDLSKSDIYSLGMCLIENMLGDRYFPREGKAFRIHIQKHLHGYSPALIKTLQRMVSVDPSKRPTASQLCEIGKKDQEETGKIRRRVSI
jgi:serine/threonine protein kinase